MAIVFALLAALFIGLNTIVIRKSLDRATPFTVATILTFIGAVIFSAMAAVTLSPGALWANPTANLYFIAAGLFAPAMVRWLFFVSIDRVGASISSSILSTSPVFSAVMAVVFLGEHLSVPMAAGLLLIVGGIVLFERDLNHGARSGPVHLRDMTLPLLAALASAIAINFRKMGLNALNLPILGSAMGFGTTLLVYLIILALSPSLRRGFRFEARDIPFFLAGGCSLAVGWLCIFYALSFGPVVLVAPLTGLHPIVVLFLSLFLLRDVEKVTRWTVLGCLTVLIGVVLTTAT